MTTQEAAATLGRIQEATFARTAASGAFPPERRMDPDALVAFLTSSASGVLATVRRDGRPHASPTGFALVGPRIVIASPEGAARVDNLRHEPHASLVVTAGQAPDAVVVAEGTCRLVAPLEASLDLRAPFRAADGSLARWIEVLIVLMPERLLSYVAPGFSLDGSG